MSSRELVVLGTASQAPTRTRNHNGYLLRWDQEGLLFDPGEGTQRQMLLAGVTASQVTCICVTHFHGDHCLGLPGVLARMALDRVPHVTDLCFPAQSQDSLGTNLGMKVSYPWKFGRVLVTPQGSASWQHEFAYSALPVEARFANGAGDLFTVWGPHIGRDSALVEAGLTVQWCPRVATYLNYDGKFNSSYQSNTVNGGCRVDF